jgi:hypothetical protein
MKGSNYRVARDTHHTVSAGILDAIGRGFLIATAGLVAGLMFGTADLAALSLWTVGVAAASGVACMIGSTLVRNAGCDRCEGELVGSPQAANVREGMAPMPVMAPAGEVEPEERWARRTAVTARQREQSAGTGRGA